MDKQKAKHETENYPLTPGSDLAIDNYGCICPYWDNHRGVGRWDEESKTFLFWVTQDCPLHDQKEEI